MNATFGTDTRPTWRQVRAILIAAWQSYGVHWGVRGRASALFHLGLMGAFLLMSLALLSAMLSSKRGPSIENPNAFALLLWGVTIFTAGLYPVILLHHISLSFDVTLARTVPALARALKWTVGLIIITGSCAAALVATVLDGHPVYAAAIVAGVSAAVSVPRGRFGRMAAGVAVGAAAICARLMAPDLPALPITIAVAGAGLLLFRVLRGDTIVPRTVEADHDPRLRSVAPRGSINRSPAETFLPTWARVFARHNYDRCLSRTLATPRPLPSALMALGLGPNLHWSSALSLSLSELLVLLGGVGLTHISLLLGVNSAGFLFSLLTIWVAGLFSQYSGASSGVLVYALRHEQALLNLAPGSLQGPALNRWLALHLCRWHVARSSLSLCVMVPLAVLSCALASGHFDSLGLYATPMDATVLSARRSSAVFFAVAGGIMMLLMLPQLWRDWSQRVLCIHRLPGVWLITLIPGFATYLLLIHPTAWEDFNRTVFPLLVPLAASVAVLIPFLMIRRWRAMMRAPVPWPAGRR